MTNNILIQKLRFSKTRINTLKERLLDIKETKIIKNYGGFKPGMFNMMYCVNIFDCYDEKIDFFRNWISKTFEPDSYMYSLEYHLQNIIGVISPYYYGLIDGEFTPNNEVIECVINGLATVSDTIDNIIERLENEPSDIDC